MGATRAHAKNGARKEHYTADYVHRLVNQCGLRTVHGSNPCWRLAKKIANPPKAIGGTDHRHSAICGLCFKHDPSRALVKLGCADSPKAMVEHLEYYHLAEWQSIQKPSLVPIHHFGTTHPSSNTTNAHGGSSAPTSSGAPAKTTSHQHMGVEAWKETKQQLFGGMHKTKPTVVVVACRRQHHVASKHSSAVAGSAVDLDERMQVVFQWLWTGEHKAADAPFAPDRIGRISMREILN